MLDIAEEEIRNHFYLCLVDEQAKVYMFRNNKFIPMTAQACKDLYLRPHGTSEWSAHDWFFANAPVHFVTSDHTKPRTFIADGQLMLNIYVEPFYTFPLSEQIQTRVELQFASLSERNWLKNLINNDPTEKITSVIYTMDAVCSIANISDDNMVPFGITPITYPKCMRAALLENIPPIYDP